MSNRDWFTCIRSITSVMAIEWYWTSLGVVSFWWCWSFLLEKISDSVGYDRYFDSIATIDIQLVRDVISDLMDSIQHAVWFSQFYPGHTSIPSTVMIPVVSIGRTMTDHPHGSPTSNNPSNSNFSCVKFFTGFFKLPFPCPSISVSPYQM